MIIEHLAQAEAHVQQGGLHVVRQRELVERLREPGLDISQAEALLGQFEDSSPCTSPTGIGSELSWRDQIEALSVAFLCWRK